MMNRSGKLVGNQPGVSNTPPGMYPRPTESQSHPNLQQGFPLPGFRSDTVLGGGGPNMTSQMGSGMAGAFTPVTPGAPAISPTNNPGMFGNMGMIPGAPGGGGLFQNPMLQPGPSGGMAAAPNPMLNCLATLISNIIQTRKGYQNNCCVPANCPVPFIIRKVKPCQKKKRCQTPRGCGQPCSNSGQPSSCCSNNNNNNNCCETKIRTLSKRGCCPPKSSCCCKSRQSNALWLGPQKQDIASTNPFENNIAPILLVQGGRCQTIQIADIGCKCHRNDRRRSSTSSTGRKRKRRRSKSSSSSKTSSSASSSGKSGDSDESESDED